VRLPEDVLRLTLANVLALSGLKLVNVPNIYLVVALGLSAVGVVATVMRERRRWLARRDERLGAGLASAPD
jgi:cell division protein FtsL